jgi:hypothetical protein
MGFQCPDQKDLGPKLLSYNFQNFFPINLLYKYPNYFFFSSSSANSFNSLAFFLASFRCWALVIFLGSCSSYVSWETRAGLVGLAGRIIGTGRLERGGAGGAGAVWAA